MGSAALDMAYIAAGRADAYFKRDLNYWDFAAGTAPVLTTTASAVDRVDYIVRTSTSIHAVATLAYS